MEIINMFNKDSFDLQIPYKKYTVVAKLWFRSINIQDEIV